MERLLSAVYVYPFHCQLCGRRFRALQWGKRYSVQSQERREYERVAVHAPLVVVSDRGRVQGEVTELSMEGCTATTSAPLAAGATVRVELHLVPAEGPIAVAAAVVRSARGETAGLHFVRLTDEEKIRLRSVVAGLMRSQHDATVPEGPMREEGRLGFLRSADFWLLVILIAIAALVVMALFPAFSLCTWGVNC